MSKWDTSWKVRCPYYHHENKNKISCDTAEDGTCLHIAFDDPRKKAAYKKNYCNSWHYEKCPIARYNAEALEGTQI